MKLLKQTKSAFLVLISILTVNMSYAQDTVQAIEVKRPIYEQLGVSSTTLFIIMLLFTILLLFILTTILKSTKNVFLFKRNNAKIGLLLTGLGSSFFGNTQVAENVNSEALINFSDSAFWAFFILDVILVMLILYFIVLMKGILSEFAPSKKSKGIFSKWNKTLTNAVNIEDEGSILLDHNYDGIQELDNDLPPWWKYGFYATIVWAVVYFGVFELFGIGKTQSEEYIAEVEQLNDNVAAYKAANPDLITIDNITLLTKAEDLAVGKKEFVQNCVSCHRVDGGGGIGPNLTDDSWIYGHDIKGVFNTISEGAKNGMIPWKDFMSSDKIQAVASYVISLELAIEGKAAEGNKIEE